MGVEQLAFSIFAWLSTYALHSTVLLLLAWLASVGMSRVQRLRDSIAAVRECVWKVALVGGIVTATLQMTLGIEPVSARWTIARASPVASAPPARVREPVSFAVDGARKSPPIERARFVPWQDELAGQPARVPRDLASASLEPPVDPALSTTLPPMWIRLAVAAWLLVVAAGLVMWAEEWRRLGRHLGDRAPITRGPVFEAFERLRRRSGRGADVRISAAPGIAAPITLGFWTKEICLPPRTATSLDRDEIEALLAHEMAHAHRRDPAWLSLSRAIEIVLFFQPLNRLARVRLQDDAEYLCDDWAVVQMGERVPLASCLTEIAGWIVDERCLLPAPGMAARGSRLSLRVRRLLDEELHPERARRPQGTAILAGLAVAGAAFLVPGVAAQAGGESEITAASLAIVVPSATASAPGAEETWDAPEEGTDETSEATADESADESAGASSVKRSLEAPGASSDDRAENSSVQALLSQAATLDELAPSVDAADIAAGLATLQRELDSLQKELDRRQTPAEFQSRVARLALRFEHLQQENAQLVLLLQLDSARDHAAPPAPASTLSIQEGRKDHP